MFIISFLRRPENTLRYWKGPRGAEEADGTGWTEDIAKAGRFDEQQAKEYLGWFAGCKMVEVEG